MFILRSASRVTYPFPRKEVDPVSFTYVYMFRDADLLSFLLEPSVQLL